MNNKMFFLIILSIVSPVMASERKTIAAWVCIDDADGEDYSVTDIKKVVFDKNKTFEQNYCYSDKMRDCQIIKNGISSFITYKGTPSFHVGKKIGRNEYGVRFEGLNYKHLREGLSDVYTHPKFKCEGSDERVFCISLINRKNTKLISLQFTEQEVKRILAKESSFNKIVAVFGIAGLAALIYYFDLYSKCMALLGRV